MNYISVFDVIGPNMIGPSSSHTAGAVNIALLAYQLFGRPIAKAEFTLYESFARTGRGHGTDKALLGGIQGFGTDDVRIRDSYALADAAGIEYHFIWDDKTRTAHPNTVDIRLESPDGQVQTVRGESVGGGKIRIVQINEIDVVFTGDYSTLIIKQSDRPGVVAHVTNVLSRHGVNIAFMRLYRDYKGGTGYLIVESDEKIPDYFLEEIRENELVHEIMLIQI